MKNKAGQNKDKEKQVSRAAADFAVTGRHPVAIMPKLEVGQPGDRFEREADNVADRIVQMPDSNLVRKSENEMDKGQTKPPGKETAPWIQRFSNNEALQAKSDHGVEAPSWLENQLRSSKGNGQTLPASSRSFMESRFGADFGNVKIHADNKASTLSRSINAKAFTHGSDIYFAKNQFSPETQTGKHLLAHELTHVVQQNGGNVSRSMIQKAEETEDAPKHFYNYAGMPATKEIKYDVPLIHQEKEMSCWHAAARMLWAFRKYQSIHPLPDVYDKNNGISVPEFVTLAKELGLNSVSKIVMTYHWTGVAELLNQYGPLWVAGYWWGVPHIIVVTGVDKDGTLHINDPDKGKDKYNMLFFNKKIASDVSNPIMYLATKPSNAEIFAQMFKK